MTAISTLQLSTLSATSANPNGACITATNTTLPKSIHQPSEQYLPIYKDLGTIIITQRFALI
jgi:hypothetical protein